MKISTCFHECILLIARFPFSIYYNYIYSLYMNLLSQNGSGTPTCSFCLNIFTGLTKVLGPHPQYVCLAVPLFFQVFVGAADININLCSARRPALYSFLRDGKILDPHPQLCPPSRFLAGRTCPFATFTYLFISNLK